MKRYNIVNNTLGWLCFVVAALTYLLTIEPTASFWDCPEFILQGAKLEIGHPPGNPMFMLTARFFITLFGNDMHTAAVAVNCMSALLSAGTILLLFWSVTHLIRRLIVRDDATEISWARMALIMGGGLCSALAYTWSDTFWFSAVEGEVYAYSSFCTALVIWLIFKWENRADQPHSDRYLLLIAYVIGISIAVHLLNLLCIPAIGLVIYYRKWKHTNTVGSLIALAVSFAVVALILFGMVPGVMKIAQWFERMTVNGLGMSYNWGTLIYAVLLVAVLVWGVRAFYTQRSLAAMKWSLLLGVMLSGVLLIGSSVWLPLLLTAALAVWLFGFCKRFPTRIGNLVVCSLLVIIVGYSSYALLLIRSSANTPMNQNAPDTVFNLASYLNREQYGKTPLLYGPTVIDQIAEYPIDENGRTAILVKEDGTIITQQMMDGRPTEAYYYDSETGTIAADQGTRFTKKVKSSPDEADEYVEIEADPDYKTFSEANVFFPRMHASAHNANYRSWTEMPDAKVPQDILQAYVQPGKDGSVTPNGRILAVDEWEDGQKVFFIPSELLMPELEDAGVATFVDRSTYAGGGRPVDILKAPYSFNLSYFINYQLSHMYWRYFMWNFAGRQNDLAGNGEPHLGNWISGIPFIDNARLGDQSMLPDEYGAGNKGHNVYYMLPLLLGIIGLLWQSLCRHRASDHRGIEQFWVVFFLFFMTGIAIVLYLNQTPAQPRERDYAFAGSFYAFAMWMGMAVPALGIWLSQLFAKFGGRKAGDGEAVPSHDPRLSWGAVVPAVLLGLFVPLQMVSQTWDDHDRSGRYMARDFGMNYLASVGPDAVIFTYGDNDTFPLWYAQEVEGFRQDVKVVNLSYLTGDWYVESLRMPHHGSKPLDLLATPQALAYRSIYARADKDGLSDTVDARTALTAFYRALEEQGRDAVWPYRNFYIAGDSVGAAKAFNLQPGSVNGRLGLKGGDMQHNFSTGQGTYQNGILVLDIVANTAANGWKRPVYFASTVPDSERSGFGRYVYSTGMADRVTPFAESAASPVVEDGFRNIVEKYRWGGLDQPGAENLYLDETVSRMIVSTRESILSIVRDLIATGDQPASAWAREWAAKNGLKVPANRYDMARLLLEFGDRKISPKVLHRYPSQIYSEVNMLIDLYGAQHNPADLARLKAIVAKELPRYAKIEKYYQQLSPANRAKARADIGYSRQLYSFLQQVQDELPSIVDGSYYTQLAEAEQAEAARALAAATPAAQADSTAPAK